MAEQSGELPPTAAATTASPTGNTTPPQDVRQGEDPLSSSSSPSTSRKKKGDPLTSSSSPSNSRKKMKDTLSSSSSPSTSRKKTEPPNRDDTDGAGKSPIQTRRRSGALSGRREEETTFGGGDGGGLIMAAGESTQGGGRGTSTRASVDSTGGGSVPVPAPRTIRNGLKLKAEMDGQSNPSISFTYAFSSFTEKPLHIDWKIIVNNEDIESQHIRCHALQPGDKIKDLVSSFKKALAKAVVLINTQDNYTLAPELTEGMERGGFPIIILKKSNGEQLVEFLEKYYEHDVLARLDIVSSTDTQQAQAQQQSTVTQVEESVTGNKAKGTRSGSEATGFQRFKQALGFNPKAGTDLKNEVKRLMFTNDKEPIPVSNDEARFVMVMSAFTNYEKQAKPDSNHSDVVDVLRKLKQHINECFLSDIPLYLVLSYRLHITYSLYDCDELGGFITGCIDKFESLEPKKMTTAISTFLEKDDFKITFLGSGETAREFNTNIYFLMETACVELARVSYNIHRRLADTQKSQTSMAQGIQKAFCQGFVYSRMLWTTLTLKLHDKRTSSVTRSTANLWQDHLVKYSSRVVLDLNAIREVKRGLELGRLLKLPPDVSFNYLHMKDFLVGGGKTVRPLAHVETYFRAVESYIPLEADLADFLANVRANYDLWIRDGTSGKVATASVEGTLLATIKEGIAFVDTMNDICNRRKVDPTLVESDGIKWVLLLLHLVDFTSDKAEVYIKQFVHSRSKVLKGQKCRQEVKKYIRDTTRANFPRLTIQQFGALFKAFKMYSITIVEEFLRIYIVQQEVRINDPTWHSFIGEVVLRFGGARNHFFLLDFLKSVADSYLVDNRQTEFVLDLMQLNVPKLFAIEEGADEATEKEDMEVGKQFTIFLRSYINRNALKHSILTQMTSLLGSISEKDDDYFQHLILSVLKKEVIPEFKVLQGQETAVSDKFHAVLQGAVSTLCKDLTWIKAPTMKQKFCWGLVASCCSKINITQHDLDWVHCYSKVLNQVGYIFNVYCSGKKLTESQCVIIEKFPDEIAAHPSEDVRRYFEWVRDIQTVMKEWEDRFMHQRANYDQILLYASNHTHLHSLGITLCVSSLVCDAQDSHQMKTQFLTEFEALNISLIKYLPDQPDVKWCTLPALLQEYGVSFPRKLQEMISKYVIFPGDKKPLGWEAPMNPVPPSTTGQFQPGHEVSLQLSRNVSLYQLAELITELGNFQQPLIGHLEMLVFFKLNKSVMFDKYLRVQIGHNTERLESFKPQSIQTSSQFSGFQFSVPVPSLMSVLPPSSGVGSEEGLPIKVFIRSLESTRDLLSKVTRGDAKYSEIIAEGALDLENLDVKREFAMLVEYSTMIHLPCNGLSGVQSMLELFQYSTHINNIDNVCTQYKLKGCLDDPKLEKLKVLVGELVSSEDARAKITPNEASKKMREVKETLGFTEKTNSKTLDLFAVIQDSAVFYQFVRDKQFYGNTGTAIFYQQYQLITAQLQHEEYDEQVLNHLYAAFKLMTPFMDHRQDLGKLMSKVLELDVTNGLRQLETVNANITLIRLWFSRAEGDTLQNVANELDCIISTGYYLFTLSHDSSGGMSAQIMLEYKPSTSSQTQQPQSHLSSGHHGPSSSSSEQNAFSFEDGTLPPPDKTLPRMLSKMESQGPSEMGHKLSNMERWNTEQIGDFVRKLGFLDKEKDKEGGDKIKHFLHVSEVAYKLLELYVKLRELGHIQYINEGNTGPPLACTIDPENAEERVKETEVILKTWTHEVERLRHEFSWLLFFGVPKLLRLFRLLSEEQEDSQLHLKRVVHEISFLCTNNVDARQRINASVQRAHDSCKNTVEETDPPVRIVGAFLKHLFEGHVLPHRCRPSSPLRPPRSITASLSVTQEFVQLLHFCPGYTQDRLLRVIVGLYSGVPESFEVFHCRPTTTEEELNLFLKRASKYPLQYLILEVNKLPYKLQEYLMQLRLMVQQEVQERHRHLQLRRTPSSDDSSDSSLLSAPTIHFVETSPSVLREMPWIQLREHKEPKLSFDEARNICLKTIVNTADFCCIQLVYGYAGDGKTHYIKSQLNQMDDSVIIAVNEAFTPLKAISKLRSLPLEKKNCAIFFNFTMLPPGGMVDEKERERYDRLMEVIGWFFFDLFILGYVEDPNTGKSFRLPGGLKWAVYIEVPSREHNMSPGEALKHFTKEVPVLGLIGTQHMIPRDKPYSVDEDVQLVCKYLKAHKTGGTKGIDKLFREGGQQVKFSTDPDLSDEECQDLLQIFMSEHIRRTKITQRLFIKYMKRRCMFLDTLPGFNFNTGSGEYIRDASGQRRANDTKQLGSTLMKTMLNEVKDFCDPDIKDNWSHKPHQQLIYDFKDGGGSLGLLSLHPEKLPDVDKRQFSKIGVEMPSMMRLYDRGVLDGFLSRALNIELDKDKRITTINDSAYVLTLDYTIKMLNIHERYECGVPVIIEGETGVGKTALVEMLSKLWNQSLLLDWKRKRGRIIEFFQQRLGEIETEVSGNYQACVQAVENITSGGENIDKDGLLLLCQLPDGSRGKLYSQLRKILFPMKNDPVVALLTLKESKYSHMIEDLFDEAELNDTAEATANLLHAVLTAQLKSTFHKINVHAAMTPTDIQNNFRPVFEQATALKDAFEKRKRYEQESATQAAMLEGRKRESLGRARPGPMASIKSLAISVIHSPSSSSIESLSSASGSPGLAPTSSLSAMNTLAAIPPPSNRTVPFVTVFLDEVNTSSCVGLFKEIIVDKTFDGEPIPDNVFIVAACNPHRGNSLATHVDSKENWVRGSYYVRRLHPTLRYLMWDYGSLDESQERDYINSKLKMLNRKMSDAEIAGLTNLIVTSQNCMRDCAYEQLLGNRNKDVEMMHLAQISSRSCVSQRDIQRVFTLYQWLMTIYERKKPQGQNRPDYNRRAVLVALGIVYYMRLNGKYRTKYQELLNGQRGLPGEVNFTKAFNDELDWYINQVELPKGIARTQALKENLFATIICTVTHTPLIIVGAPGSSKTLSFNQAIANLKGPESKKDLFRDVKIFSSLDPHYYQCSRRTTSNEIQTVFSRAINRQRSHRKFKLPIHCVVFMDEAGLPEESHESLKVLHYHLDKQEVSFVAITNHVLDAAKTNRAVSLFRPAAGDDDLKTLAIGCLCSTPENPPPELKPELEKVEKFCAPYSDLMKNKEFAKFFGLRDFIHFVNYLRRKKDLGHILSPQIVMQALERNFNGCEPEQFDKICKNFFKAMDASPELVHKRGILEIVQDSLQDRPQDQQDITENEVRYKLIIDPSEDDSLVRLLFAFGVLQRDNTRMYVCSDFPGDGQVQKINTIAAIRHSAIEGHTVVMSQTDDIHESFYDLFNQRFRRIDDPEHGPRYYTNIAIGAHLKPSRVHPNFQCVVVVKKSEVKHTPSPFLNRFEKYLISYSSLLETAFNHMPPCMAIVVKAAIEKVKDFIQCVSGGSSLYGLQEDTLESLVLTLLPPLKHEYKTLGEPSVVDSALEVKVYLIQELLQSLRHCAGFHIPPVNVSELELDADQLFSIVLQDPVFEGLMADLDHQIAAQAVVEAINMLHTASKPEDQKSFDLSPEGCMVISLLQQWFVRYFSKKLMQLMTSEALILNRNKIPFSYVVNYLSYQNHFSLKELVHRYYNTLEATGWDISGSPNKVLCFTRSSPLVHQLPAQHLTASFDMQTKLEDVKQTLKDLVFEKTEQLVVCKLSSIVSQTAIQELLKGFIQSEKTNVCVIVANMQETSQQIVNHLRIMIEETEALAPQKQKLFVFLLHFPPAQFFKPCYPSLFLKGWDHCYLDTIAHSAVKGVIDIRDWFWQCCFQPEGEQQDEEGDSLVKALVNILPQAIPILSSRVFFGARSGGTFSAPMSGSRRSKFLSELLFDREVGKVLCERFRSYWKPGVMAEHLDRAASFSKNRESTLNITDSIQTMFKTLFFDFLVYMISRINDRYNIDVLFERDSSPAIQFLFLDILQVFPLPALSQVSVLSANLQEPPRISHIPCFPFFTFVSGSMEKLVEKSQQEANVKVDILEDNKKEESLRPFGSVRSSVQYDQNSIMVTLQEAVCNRIREQMNAATKSAIVLTLDSISKHPELWPRYFSDFILHKMKLEATATGEGIAQKVLEAYFAQIHSQDALQRMVILHTYLHVYQLNLAKMAGVFRPLNKIQRLHAASKAVPHALSPLPSSPSHEFLSAVKSNPAILGTPEHLASFVIETLFSALVSSTYNTTMENANEKLTVWFKAYRDVMTLPTLKKHVYQALEPISDNQTPHLILIEAKLNVLHATYLALLSEPRLDDDLILKGQQVFQTLFSRHFEENQELKSDCPRLSNVTNVAVEVLTSSLFTPSLHLVNQGVRRLMEGLFAHFFSADRRGYHDDDVRWFLELANEQEEWRANLYEADADVVSGDLSDDILTKFEKSVMRKHPPGHPESTDVVPHGAISLNVFKLYLGRILGTCPKDYSDEATKSGPLELYRHEPRTALGHVLVTTMGLGTPGPYIPVFYQECPPIKPGANSDNALMQQPLAHLYFLTVLEHLMTKQWLLSGLVISANSISALCDSPEVCDRDKVLLWIELQAVVQVIAQNVPYHLDPSKQDQIVQFNPLQQDINRLLNDDAMGGGATHGHAMVVALHLYKSLKSSRKFTEMMTKNFETTIKSVDCLIPFNDQLKAPKEPTPHLLPFMLAGVEGEQASLYRKVSKAMHGIHRNKEEPVVLISIAQECSQQTRHTRGPHHATTSFTNTIDKHLSFRMMVWLVTYYEFYDKKIKSTLLCNIIGGQEMSQFLKEEGYIRVIQCFLNPDLMLNRPESPNPLTGDQQVLELLPRGGHRPIQRRGQAMEDPLHSMFVRDDKDKEDQSDVDLRHSIANMVAIVMGCPSHSNHLWYHMFAADKLVNTYMTGFMYNAKITPEGLLYDCGVELSPDGKFGRQDYMKHASRGTYTLHSLYLLLWANFGAFCISLLTQPDSDDKIHGNLISDWISVRHYCVSQLRTLWMHMRNNLDLSEEERTFFVMRAMKKFYELVLNPHETTFTPKGVSMDDIIQCSMKGYFESREELDDYEKTWHLFIYQPTWNELKNKFADYSQYWQSELFLQLRRLELHYPKFPTEEDFTHRLLGSGDLKQHSEGGELMLLSRFSMEWPRLQAGGLLLPKLVEFYQWLHTQLAHLVTYEKATTLPIRRVVELATKRYNQDMGDHLLRLYEFLKVNYNKYVELIGGAIGVGACAAVKRGDKVYTIADDVPLLHFLTDVEEEEQGNDWLFTVIDDIVSAHNLVIESLYSFVATKKMDMARLFPDEPAKMYPSEMDETNCLVGEFKTLHEVNEFLQLIRSRYQPPLKDTPLGQQDPKMITLSISGNIMHQPKRLPAFQLVQLEEDIISSYIAGKPLIHKPSLLRTIFKFRQSKKTADSIPQDVVHSKLDLATMTEKLPDAYKLDMEDTLLKRFEYEFHSAGYHTLVEVITGLRTVVGHLMKEVIGQDYPHPRLEALTVPQFMLTLYELITKPRAVLNEIGITNVTATQMDCLAQLPLRCSVRCMLLFASWVHEGFYDFCNLPFPLKTHMSDADTLAVEQELREKWTGSVCDLLTEVKQLIGVLKHSEGDITKMVNESSQKPIINYVIDYHMLDKEDQLAKCIPSTILLQHYVSFRQALRRLRLRLQLELEGQGMGEEHPGHGRWPEFVDDLWQKRLPHLRQEVYEDGMFMFDPTTGRYGFQEGSDFGTEDEFMTDLMNEPEYPGGEGEEAGEFGEEDGARHDDVDDSFEEFSESELEPAISHSYDLDQASGDEGEGESSKHPGASVSIFNEDLDTRLKTDKDLQKRVLSLADQLHKGETSIQEKARQVSIKDVTDFLASMKLDKYIREFEENEISGDVVIDLKPSDLSDLGVNSALDKIRILVGFRRQLEGGGVKFSTSKLVVALSQNNLSKHRKPFEEHKVDGDMLLYEDEDLVRSMLKEIGIKRNVDITKIIAKFKTFASTRTGESVTK